MLEFMSLFVFIERVDFGRCLLQCSSHGGADLFFDLVEIDLYTSPKLFLKTSCFIR